MLYGRHMLPTIPASDLARARAWYADKLGYTTGQQEAAALLYRSGEDRLFLLFSSPGGVRQIRRGAGEFQAGAVIWKC